MAELTREIKVAATPDAVFPYLTDPERMGRWMGTEVALEPRPGGALRIAVNPDAIATGEFVEVEQNRRVVFTFGWEGSPIGPGSTTVEVSLEQDGDHTIVRLTHRGLPDANAVAEHAQGWDHYLARLGVAASGGDPGPDRHP